MSGNFPLRWRNSQSLRAEGTNVSPAVKKLEEPGEVQQTTITPFLRRISYAVTMPEESFSRQAAILGKLFYLQFQKQQKFPLLPMDFHPSETSPALSTVENSKAMEQEEPEYPCILPKTSQKWEGVEHWWLEWKHTESCSSQVEFPIIILQN